MIRQQYRSQFAASERASGRSVTELTILCNVYAARMVPRPGRSIPRGMARRDGARVGAGRAERESRRR